MTRSAKEYTSITITKDLAEKIDQAIPLGAYQSRADFVRDAVRRLITTLEGAKQ